MGKNFTALAELNQQNLRTGRVWVFLCYYCNYMLVIKDNLQMRPTIMALPSCFSLPHFF